VKFFVSSLISGMEAERTAAVEAIEGLGHQAKRAEDFSASPESPRVACLTGVRECDGLVLIASGRYGQKQQSGKSATHEEYDAAAGNKPVFVFVDENASFEADQSQFLEQVQDWQSGRYTARYDDPTGLRRSVSTALHRWLIAQSAGSFDPTEAEQRALQLLPPERRGYSTGDTALVLSVAPGPVQAVLRPSELAPETLGKHIIKQALFGDPALFDAKRGTTSEVKGHTLTVRHEHEFVSLDEQGSIVIARSLTEGKDGVFAVIEEEVCEKITTSLRFAAALLDHIDPTHRLTHAVPALNLYEASYRTWRTRAEHERNRTSGTMNMHSSTEDPVVLRPAHRSRGALTRDAAAIGEDFSVLLRRARTR
jgi:hypothetical protein